MFHLNMGKELKVGIKALGQDLAIHLAKHIEIMGNPTKGLDCRMWDPTQTFSPYSSSTLYLSLK